jgi:hypothetical protein
MPTAFRPVNNPLPAGETSTEITSPSPVAPRPTTAPAQGSKPLDEATTPTRANFGAGTLSSQDARTASELIKSIQVPESGAPTYKRGHSELSGSSKDSSDDVDMDDSDGGHTVDGGVTTGDESVSGDGKKPKKKKSQRFYCTDYPPCNLSFTRSEHLARHIRYEATPSISLWAQPSP